MTSYSLTLDKLHNTEYPENSPERLQQKALEDKALGTFVEALNKFDYADSNAEKRQSELAAAKVIDRTGVPVRYEPSSWFWDKGVLVFPNDMNESSVRATLVKIGKGGEALPLDGNQEDGYSVAVSDLDSTAPDLVEEAKAEQQKEVIDLKAALKDAAVKTLEAHGWDAYGHNHRWQKYTPHADSLPQTAEVSPKTVTAAAVNPPAVEIHASATYALVARSPALSKPESTGVEKTVVAQTLPVKTQHLSHRAQVTAQNAKIFAEIRDLSEKTRLAALESASASKDVVRSLGGVQADIVVAENSNPQK